MSKLAGFYQHTTDATKKDIFTRSSTHRAAVTASVMNHLAWEGAAVWEKYSDRSHAKLEWPEGEVAENPYYTNGMFLAPLYKERMEGFLSLILSMKGIKSQKPAARFMVAEAKVTELDLDALPADVREDAKKTYWENEFMERCSMTTHWNQRKNDEIRKAHPEAIVVTGFVRFIMTVGDGKIVITSETVPVDAPAKPALNLTVIA